MSATPHDGSGTTVTFPGFTGSITNLTYTKTDVAGDDTIDISHIGQSAGASVLTVSRPLKGSATDTGREVQIDFIGIGGLDDGATGTLAITGGLSLSRAATVASASVTLGVNDVIRGSATFRVAR
jgi:hypothetical protein